MAVAYEHSKDLKKHNYQEIGRQYLTYLLEDKEYEEAARLCVKILGKSKAMWEEEVYKFAQIHQLKAIAPYLPREEPKLSPGVYEMVLNEFLQTDHVVSVHCLMALLHCWTRTLTPTQIQRGFPMATVILC